MTTVLFAVCMPSRRPLTVMASRLEWPSCRLSHPELVEEGAPLRVVLVVARPPGDENE